MKRTDEEKARDIFLYEKKACAAEIAEAYQKAKKKGNIAALICALIVFLCSYTFLYSAYDEERLLLLGAILAADLILVLAARTAVGAVYTGSPVKFFKLGRLCSKWKDARREMHRIEEKHSEKTAFEDDVTKAEHRLLRASEALIRYKSKLR